MVSLIIKVAREHSVLACSWYKPDMLFAYLNLMSAHTRARRRCCLKV